MPCRCCRNQNTQNISSDTTAVSNSTGSNTSNDRCNSNSFWPKFANPPRSVSSGSNDTSDTVCGCCGCCSRR